MFSSTGTTTGIDLGTKSVKFVRARGRERPEALLTAAIEDLPIGDAESWPRDARAALERILKAHRLHPRDLGHVVASISGAAVQLRQVDLPPLEDGELKVSLKYEARKHLSLGSEEAALDCQVLSRSTTGAATLIVGAPVSLVTSRVKVLNGLGIDPEVVNAAPLALLNGLYSQSEPNTETIAVLDLGASGTTVTMARRGGVLYTRTVPLVASDHPETPEKLTRAFSETSQFFSTMNERRRVDHIYLSGGNARQVGLDIALQDNLGIPVSPLDLLQGLHYSPAGIGGPPRDELEQQAPQLSVAAGLLYWGVNGV